LLFLFTSLTCIHYMLTGQSFVIPAFVLSALSTFFFITNKKIKAISHYHYFVLDGTMLLQGALVCLSFYIKIGYA
jgi:hypothetical protein